ncbi:MAG TPA: hypothetical protein VJ935_01155 [Acidimicrobiia bacterium]|nr:hypothetical protein [Acidimicrobiia bacterium]
MEIKDAVASWRRGELTWDQLVDFMGKVPLRTRVVLPPVKTLEESWRRAEEDPQEPGSWDHLYLEWLFQVLTDDEFHELERALLKPR